MSFFGFDPTGPPRSSAEAYDFQDTYEGLGENLREADDQFNNETFGNGQQVGKDYNFANQAQSQPQSAYQSNPNVTYAQAAHAPINDDQFMQDLWGTTNAPQKPEQTHEEKKILSLEEIEAQLTAIDTQQQQQQQHYPPQHYGIPPPQFGGWMPPNGFMPAPYGQYPNMPNQYNPIPPQQFSLQQQQDFQRHQQLQQQQQFPPAHQVQQQNQHQIPQQAQQQQELKQLALAPQIEQQQAEATFPPDVNVDLSHFPVLGAKGQAPTILIRNHEQGVQSQGHGQGHGYVQSHGNRQQFDQQGHQFQRHHQQRQYHQQHQQHHDMTPEQEAKFSKRQEKVSRIMKYSGIMTPKDKDFVTRFQLSQIVTEDPYNEDFYAQVFKVIHPKAINNSIKQDSQHNSIAQAYLEQSGHRLGGRHKRADVALQRMQQQVQKAVAVAKDRPKASQYVKEGALGKISFSSGKKPRQQLEIISKAEQRERERLAADEKTEKDSKSVKVDGSTLSSSKIKKYTKKDIMSIIENIISNLMTVESKSRTNPDVDTSKLWESFRVLEQPSSSGDDEAEVNPFIQCLNYNKALKVLLRLFKFLSREQIVTIVTLIMSNLENLTVVKHGSYTTYESKNIPEPILKLVDSYSLTFTKVLMNSVLDLKFNEIIGLLVILIEHNNVSFVSTTKIGLTILTTLLSKAELIIGEGTISATDLSEWTSCYDELFTSLESRIAAIFPQNLEDVDDGSSKENYVWQFLATLSLGGKLSHQRIIVDEVRDEIFGVMGKAKAIDNADVAHLYKKQNLLNNLNMFLVVMGLVADENEIRELQT